MYTVIERVTFRLQGCLSSTCMGLGDLVAFKTRWRKEREGGEGKVRQENGMMRRQKTLDEIEAAAAARLAVTK